MSPTQKPRVKICCISSIQEAQLAISYGAFAIGLVSEMPSGPGVISESLISEIAATIPPWISSFLLTSKQDPAAIIKQLRRCGTNTVQICDSFPIDGYKKIKDALSWMAIVQVIHVRGPDSIEEAMAIAPHVDGILLDSGNQLLAIKELGGTGRIHDWEISRTIREAIMLLRPSGWSGPLPLTFVVVFASMEGWMRRNLQVFLVGLLGYNNAY